MLIYFLYIERETKTKAYINIIDEIQLIRTKPRKKAIRIKHG